MIIHTCKALYQPLKQIQNWRRCTQFTSSSRNNNNNTSTSTSNSTSTSTSTSTYNPRPIEHKQMLKMIRLDKMRMPVLDMLHIEEMLLRAQSGSDEATPRNYLVVNRLPHQHRAIVLGISGKPERLVNMQQAKTDNVPLIRRFSGGGTVYVDDGTILVSLIVNANAIQGMQPFPRQIMKFTTENIYRHVFQHEQFTLREHDYCIGERKVGGNAQSLTRGRWLHHTSFLYKYELENIERYLAMPEKQPEYRAQRTHTDFLMEIKNFIEPETFVERIGEALSHWFHIVNDSNAEQTVAQNTRKNTFGVQHLTDGIAWPLATLTEEEAACSQHMGLRFVHDIFLNNRTCSTFYVSSKII